MNIANLLTSLRIVLSPVFFVFAFLPLWGGSGFAPVSVVALWVLFIIIELTDLFDGIAARALGIVSDLGKLLDPFSDVVSRLTYFIVFTAFSIMPVWMFTLILYREVGIIFVRMMMTREGIALAARAGGKLKAVLYAVSTALGLLMLTHVRLGIFHDLMPTLPWVVLGTFGAAVLVAWISFADYLILVIRHFKNK